MSIAVFFAWMRGFFNDFSPASLRYAAAKCVSDAADEELNDFANEVAVLRDCSHPNIVNYVGAYKKGAEIFVRPDFFFVGDFRRPR
jgi:hypothetical protein